MGELAGYLVQTFYWHDYETWGANPSVDRPSQFAGVRTDMNLNIVSDPLVLFCKPPEDIWPHPEACLVTGLLPQDVATQGVVESEFIATIHKELSQPETCGVGYNTLRFDDEVTRYTLYRNFFDPYEREWRNGNSRWDIIDMVRLVYALRPDGIEWPVVDGKPSFKLELLTAANGISHQSAHDAYSDVEATIALAKLIKTRKPALYEYVLNHRGKHACAALIDIPACKPLLHVSSKFSSERGCAGLIAPLAMHPQNKNAVIVYDLSVDPAPLATLSASEIHARVFVSDADLPEGVSRLPIKLIHLNKCPVLATTKLLDDKAAQRLGIDKNACEQHWQALRQMQVAGKLQEMYQLNPFEGGSDPEAKLYDGFIGDKDKALMHELRMASPEDLRSCNFVFEDARLNAMLPRYLARNHSASLSPQALSEWQEFVSQRLLKGDQHLLSYPQLCERIEALRIERAGDTKALAILDGVSAYAEHHLSLYSVGVDA